MHLFLFDNFTRGDIDLEHLALMGRHVETFVERSPNARGELVVRRASDLLLHFWSVFLCLFDTALKAIGQVEYSDARFVVVLVHHEELFVSES